ncbi:redoxin domain-containing protein [Zavarzinella formosa]|uniref:redoxin domain-containing protein n=1 Tax=Zavarzinella formosa TaxID=360055 RepID=UPI0002E1C1CE|nr:redoxin domain-containing protein [Zavarzinella formosa]
MSFKHLILGSLFWAFALIAQAEEAKPVAGFSLKDSAGKAWNLADQKSKATVIVFLSCECPMSNAYAKPLSDLNTKFKSQGVTVVGINANKEESAEQIIAHSKEYGINFPVLKDTDGAAVKALGAKMNPEAFILDDKLVVRYHGRIDNGFTGRMRPAPKTTRFDVVTALEEMLAGKPVSVPQTQSFGCPLPEAERQVAKEGSVTYHRDVAPILQNNCQSCHRPGEVGPFSLQTYKQAVKWSDGIISETKDHRMPPWKPAPSELLVAPRHLKPADVKTLEAWVAQGMPEGNPKDAPAPPKFPDGWQLGKPDAILEMSGDAVVAANGKDLFHCVVFPTNFPEDVYVAAVEVRPGNPRVVHHTIQAFDTFGRAKKLLDEAQKKQKDTDPDRGPGYSLSRGMGFIPGPANMLGGWAPGLVPQMMPEGVGQKLPKGADIVMQIHYHRTGKEETDRTKIGLYFTKGKMTEYLTSVPVPGLFLQIPAGKKDYKVDSSVTLTEDVILRTVTPHMHLLGKEIELTVTLPDGKEESVIKIPEWDYNWQEMYALKTPMKLPKGTVLRTRATYDNSDSNPLNPRNPPIPVRFGEQTENEMCFVFCGVTSPTLGNLKFKLNLGKSSLGK